MHRWEHEFNNLLTVALLCLGRLEDLISEGAPGRAEVEELRRTIRSMCELAGQLPVQRKE